MQYKTTFERISAFILVTLVLVPPITGAQGNRQQSQVEASESTTEVRLASEIEWQKLNPARGDASPQAGTIWGDQTKDNETGFLVKFVDGFSSPPHIHNVTYRGIVIAGGLHNDDPNAEPMWMKEGSYWTQPAGEVHITSARGASIGYVEIQSGPYLVKPASEAFDNGEKPINVDSTNIVWLDATTSSWIKGKTFARAARNPQMTFLWGSPEGDRLNGTLVKLPAGFSGDLESDSSSFKVIVIKGQANFHASDEIKTLAPGSYIGTNGKASHHLTCVKECTIYVRTRGRYSVVPK